MSRSIWKFKLDASQVSRFMPVGAKVLTAQMQGGVVTLWADVDPDAQQEERHFRVFGTGWNMPREMGYSDVYIGTVQDGDFVWHVYELTGV